MMKNDFAYHRYGMYVRNDFRIVYPHRVHHHVVTSNKRETGRKMLLRRGLRSMPSSLGKRCLSSAMGNSMVKDGIHYRQLEKDFDPNFLYDFNTKLARLQRGQRLLWLRLPKGVFLCR